MQEDDAERMRAWRNDPDVYRGLVERTPISAAAQARWFARTVEREAAGRELWFVIVAPDGAPIGSVSLSDLDRRSRHAQLSLFIGETAYRKHGYATDALVRVLDFAFGHLNFRRVWLRVLESNEAAQSLYRRLGFVEEGRLRDHVFEDGAYQDLLVMGVTADEFSLVRPALVERLGEIAESYRRDAIGGLEV